MSSKEIMRRRPRLVLLVQILNAAIFLVAIALLIFSVVFINKPGPAFYYSHFATIYMSSCLAFQGLQLLRIQSGPPRRKCSIIFQHIYWTVLGFCGLAAGIAYCCTPKPECAAVEILAFLDAGLALFCLHLNSPKPASQLAVSFQYRESEVVPKRKLVTLPTRFWSTFRIFNRFLMVLHALLSILAISGAIQLALLYRFDNPGESVDITLPTGDLRSVNFNCTTVPWNGTRLSTIWFEADQAHGVVDFIGVQHHLALSHGRNSCSYDPPNFGWSDRLPIRYKTYYESFVPLLKALGRQDEEIVLVGWGGGAEQVVRHAIEIPKLTQGLVLLDASPDGIEWMDEKRANNWTEAQMLQRREVDLAGRVGLTRILLSLGITWGLMSIFIPSNSTGYFDKSSYKRFRAQGMKEDMWAYQFYALQDMAAGPIDTYLTNTSVPSSIPTYAIMTFNSSTTAAGSQFYRESKLGMAESIANGQLSAPVAWCLDTDCDLGFPVKKSDWTASTLMSLGI